MEQKQNTATPSEQRWTVNEIDKLVKKFSVFKMEDSKLKMIDGIDVACAHMQAEYESKNLTADEIADLIITFNNCHPQNDAIKRQLLLQALFFAKKVQRLILDGHFYDIYKSPPITLPPGCGYLLERKGVNKAKIYDLFEKSHIGIPTVTGKITTGLCRCCRDYEVDKIETQKIVDIASISNLHLKEDGTLVISSQK